MSNCKRKEKENNVKEIVVRYDDGTEKIIKKGVVSTIEENKETDEITITMEPCEFSGVDLLNLINGFVVMADDSGILKEYQESLCEE